MMMNTGNYAEKFLDFEKKHALFDRQIEGVFYWKLIRGRVYNNILHAQGILGKRSFTVARDVRGKLRDFLLYCKAALFNAIKPYPKADMLVVTHPRKVLVNGKYEDIYTNWLIENLREQRANYLVLDVPLNWSRHPMQMDKNTRKIENFTIIKKVLCKYFSRNPLYCGELKQLSMLLHEKFGCDGQVMKEAYDQVRFFQVEYKYYMKVLKKIQPKKIWLVISYAHHALIAAAKALGIETEEIQHSLMSRHHMNYSFGGLKKVPYFPDRICLFGRFWYDIANLPLPEEMVDYYQNPIVRQERNGIRRPKNKKILFLTQPIITKYMVELIRQMLENRFYDDYTITVKLHPGEYQVWKNESPGLLELSERGVQVVDSFDVPLYDLFRDYDTVVAVASTALFEALYFGCDVYLLNVPDIVWIRSLGDKLFPTPIKTADDLAYLLSEQNHNNVDINAIFYGGNVSCTG